MTSEATKTACKKWREANKELYNERQRKYMNNYYHKNKALISQKNKNIRALKKEITRLSNISI